MNRAKLFGLALAGAAFALAAGPRAEATPIDYTFQVTLTSGSLSPATINGTFAYDSGSIIRGGLNNATGLLTELDFTLNGITYTAATANTGWLIFDSAGDLTNFLFGTTCSAGGCSVSVGPTNEWDATAGDGGFFYALPGVSALGSGDVTFAKAAVPEPGSLALLGTALVGLGLLGFTLRRRAG